MKTSNLNVAILHSFTITINILKSNCFLVHLPAFLDMSFDPYKTVQDKALPARKLHPKKVLKKYFKNKDPFFITKTHQIHHSIS